MLEFMAHPQEKRAGVFAITRRDLAAVFAVTAVSAGQTPDQPEPFDARKRLQENRARLDTVDLPMHVEPAFVFRP